MKGTNPRVATRDEANRWGVPIGTVKASAGTHSAGGAMDRYSDHRGPMADLLDMKALIEAGAAYNPKPIINTATMSELAKAAMKVSEQLNAAFRHMASSIRQMDWTEIEIAAHAERDAQRALVKPRGKSQAAQDMFGNNGKA